MFNIKIVNLEQIKKIGATTGVQIKLNCQNCHNFIQSTGGGYIYVCR